MRASRFFQEGEVEEALEEWELTEPLFRCLSRFSPVAFDPPRAKRYLADCIALNDRVDQHMNGILQQTGKEHFQAKADLAIRRLFRNP